MTDFRSRVRSGETLIGVFSDLASPLAAELNGRAGFDWTIIDLEHGAATEADLLALLYAVGSTPMVPFVRVPSAERLRVGRALDLGAAGIMLPQLQSADEVREAVRYLRYPPVGARGIALRTRGADMGALGHGDIARVVNERLVGIVQIEAAQMVEDADEIAAMDEVDVLFVGPADLTPQPAASLAGSTSRSTRTRSGRSSRPASATASRPGSSSTTPRPFNRTTILGSGSSAWAPRARSSQAGPRRCWRRLAGARPPPRAASPARALPLAGVRFAR